MRFVRLIVLLPLGLALIAATCVTNVEQQGERGPWAGEVVNTNGYTVFGASAKASIFDADGRAYYESATGALACPSTLLPGERGAFRLFVGDDGLLDDPALPLQARFNPVAFDFPGRGDGRSEGLLVTLLEQQALGVRVLVTNNSDFDYTGVSVCAVLRTDAGDVVSVGEDRVDPSGRKLVPGASTELNINFGTAPDGSIRFFPTGLTTAPVPDCCPPVFFSTWHSVDLKWFSVLLPPDWQYVPAQGIDSFVGQFAGPEGSLWFDFGPYSNNLPFEDDPAYHVHFETIGGRTAKIAEVIGARGTTGVNIPIAGTDQFPSSSLTVAGEDLSPAARAIALQVFRAIRICECAEP
jgi:hypothetical protein